MKRLISAFAAVFVMTLCLAPAWGAEPEQHVFDNADIFTDAEEAELEKRIPCKWSTHQPWSCRALPMRLPQAAGPTRSSPGTSRASAQLRSSS